MKVSRRHDARLSRVSAPARSYWLVYDVWTHMVVCYPRVDFSNYNCNVCDRSRLQAYGQLVATDGSDTWHSSSPPPAEMYCWHHMSGYEYQTL